MASDKKVSVKVVVNTEDVVVEAHTEQPLHVVAGHALKNSQSSARPLSDFDLKDANGVILDQNKKGSDIGLAEGSVLYLTLKAGITGSAD